MSMASSNIDRSQSNIYIDDPDSYLDDRDNYNGQQNVHNLPTKYTMSTMNMPSMIANATGMNGTVSGTGLKNATSMQQLQHPTIQNQRQSLMIEPQIMMMDQGQPQEQSHLQNTTPPTPSIFAQQLINERLMCLQQMMASGQNFSSIFNDDPQFAQQFMSIMTTGGFYQQTNEEPDVIEIMDE